MSGDVPLCSTCVSTDFILRYEGKIGLGSGKDCRLGIWPCRMASVALILDDLFVRVPLSSVNVLVTVCSSVSMEIRITVTFEIN